MRRFSYILEDLETGCRATTTTMKDAKAAAKTRSMKTGHVIAVIAVDNTDNAWHPQGAYYGRSWREGAYHYAPRSGR